ncbi:MAG: vWA domain-containing protein [Phycisphaerales bacterium]
MTWLTPMVGAIAAAVAVPTLLILYFLRLKRRDLDVSSTLLWKKAIQDLQANAPFQRLRRNILLFLQLLALAAALVAVAQPRLEGGLGKAEKSVVLIDRSASMSVVDETLDGKPVSRLEKAKADALAFIDQMPTPGLFENLGSGGSGGGAEAMVITFDSGAEVIQSFTGNRGLLREAVRSIAPSETSTSIEEALRLATAYVGPKVVENVGITAGAPLFIWSDGGIPDMGAFSLHPQTRIDFRAVGKRETVNVAITALRAQRPYDSPNDLAVFVGLQSTDPADRPVEVELTIDAVVVAVKEVRMAGTRSASAVPVGTPGAPEDAPSTGGVVFRLERPEGALVTARIVGADALSVDNTSRIVVPPAKRLNVALVTDGNLFLESALGGLPLGKADILTAAQFAELVSKGRTADYDVYVMDRVNPGRPVAGPGAEANVMPPGRYLTFGVAPPMRGVSIAPALEESNPEVVADWVRDHPALEVIGLDALVIAKPMRAEATESVRVIARGTTGPLMLEVADGPSKALIVCFDPLESNWPFDVSYVLFLASAIGYLGDDDANAAQQVAAGEYLTTTMPEGVARADLRAPEGARVELVTGQDGRVSYGPARRTGLYELSWSGPPGPRDKVDGGRSTRGFAVNLFDPAESAARVRTTLDLPSGTAKGSAVEDRRGLQNLWPWLLLGAVMIVMLEWVIYNRKTYV